MIYLFRQKKEQILMHDNLKSFFLLPRLNITLKIISYNVIGVNQLFYLKMVTFVTDVDFSCYYYTIDFTLNNLIK